MNFWKTAVITALLCAPAVAQTAGTGAQWRAADGAMTAQWKRTFAYMKALDARDTSRGGGFGYAPTVLESQRAWIVFRDKQCAIEAGEFVGGSGARAAHNRCLTRLTTERTAQLKRLIWTR